MPATVIPSKVKDEVLSYGYPEDGDYVAVLEVEELENFGTACGHGNRDNCFGEGIRNYLYTRGVEQVVVLVSNATPEANYAIQAMAIPINGRDRHIFAANVTKAGGSLRAEHGDHPLPGWSMFESE